MRGNDPHARGCDFDSESRPSSRLRARVGADPDQRMLQRRPHIVFVHDRGDHRALAVIGDHQIDHRVARILAHRLADLRQRHALVLRQVAVQHRRQHHAVAAVGAVPLVLPGRRVRIVHVLLDPLARRRIGQARQRLVEAAFARPQRQARVEAVRRARVGILVRGDVEAARPRRLDAPQHLRHLAEVRLVGGLQVPDLRRNAARARRSRTLRRATRRSARSPSADA